jgi:hypothetical protein
LDRKQARLTDPVEFAERAWALSLASCADRLHLASAEIAAEQMLQGNNLARMHCCHGLAEQVAASLWSSQQDLQAVYAPECDSCPQDFCLEDGAGANLPCAHLLVWARHKAPTLTSRAAALGNALARFGQEMTNMEGLPTILHLRVVEDSDLAKFLGAGQKKRWSARLQAYWLSMNEVVEVLYPRKPAT